MQGHRSLAEMHVHAQLLYIIFSISFLSPLKKIHCKSIDILHIYVNESTIYLKGGYLADVFRKNRMGIRYEFAGCSTLKCDSRVYFAQFYAYSLTSVNFPPRKNNFLVYCAFRISLVFPLSQFYTCMYTQSVSRLWKILGSAN